MKDLLFDLFNQYENVEDIISALRSLNTEKILTDKDYNYILQNYDKLLKEWSER